MIPITIANSNAEFRLLDELRQRGEEVSDKVTSTVSDILFDVRANGDDAVQEYTRIFDGRVPLTMEVSSEDIERAFKSRESSFVYALYKAAENIRAFHERQVQQSRIDTKPDGTILGQRIRGLEKVGIYVPGGTAAYPSSVLMNAIPAKIAGVKEIIMVTPPQKDGTANPDILAAAKIAGVDRVFLVGGAQ
ncbi:MAG: histidinol dehydrogenase, partial [Clostridia bacterium]|nr:histidinol dehydrogenase [Clostridia bacterium]